MRPHLSSPVRPHPSSPVRPHRVAPLVLLLALLAAACAPLPGREPTDDGGPFLGVAVAGPLPSYNAGTLDVAARGGTAAALGRVLPGFGVLGPEGRPVADTDLGVATVLGTDPLQVRYTLAAGAGWSDGVALSCADVVLAWVAHSGRYGAGAASTRGWSDVAGVDCGTGEPTATVRFSRPFQQWQALLGPGDLLPAHVAQARTGVDVVAALAAGDTAGLGRLVEFWRTGWTLPTGPADADGQVVLDPALFPASGPYRLDRVAADGSTATLVANERFAGDVALVARVVVHLSPADPAGLVAADEVQALELPALPATRDAVAGAASPVGALQTSGGLALAQETLVLGTTGTLGPVEARRALASCVPRQGVLDALVTPVAPGAGLLDTHVLVPGQLGHDATTGPAAAYATVDPAAASAAVTAARLQGATVRIGYAGPDERLARTVALVAESCGAAGLTVVDVGATGTGPAGIAAGTADAALVDVGGSALPGAGAAGLRTGAPTNWGGYSNARVDTLLDQLDTATTLGGQLPAATELETILWTDLPTIPLHQVPTVTARLDRLPSVVPNPSSAGIAWNVDRWALTA